MFSRHPCSSRSKTLQTCVSLGVNDSYTLLAMISSRKVAMCTYLRPMRFWRGGGNDDAAIADVWSKLRRAVKTVGVSFKINYSFKAILGYKTLLSHEFQP